MRNFHLIAIAALVLGALGTGCAARRPLAGPFVRSAFVEGNDLFLEKCTLSVVGERIHVGACELDRQPLPVVVQRADAPVE